MEDGKNTAPPPGRSPEITNASDIITANLSPDSLSADATLEQLRAGLVGLSV